MTHLNKSRLISWIHLLRCNQWIKNILIFFPLFFGHQITSNRLFIRCTLAAFLFCILASVIYCFNDLCDRNADRKHPVKSLRPIASGEISVRSAVTAIIVGLLLVISFSLAAPHISDVFADFQQVLVLYGIYLVSNILYSCWLKHIAILDVLVLAMFFIIRLYVGSVSTGIENSHWIILTTFLLALLLGIGKRRDDLIKSEEISVVLRQSTSNYSLNSINTAMGIVASVTIVCYIMYTLSPEAINNVGNNNLYVTSIFVIAGILRYLQMAIGNGESGSPTHLILHDRFLQICSLCWLCCYFIMIYL